MGNFVTQTFVLWLFTFLLNVNHASSSPPLKGNTFLYFIFVQHRTYDMFPLFCLFFYTALLIWNIIYITFGNIFSMTWCYHVVSGLDSFLSNNTCLLINIVPVKAVSVGPYAVRPVITPQCKEFHDVYCSSLGVFRGFLESW